jgi:DNA-binding CsgD family transcriptional regulator
MLMPAQPVPHSTEKLKLTPHQRELARLVARGLSTKAITKVMSESKGRKTSIRTISSNLINIFRANGIQNRNELAWRLINDEYDLVEKGRYDFVEKGQYDLVPKDKYHVVPKGQYDLIKKSEHSLDSLPSGVVTALRTEKGLILAKKNSKGAWWSGRLKVDPEHIISWHEFVTYEK